MYEYIPEVMTFKECKELLKVGKNTLLDLIHTGQIQSFKVGNRWKIRKQAVIEFIQYKWLIIKNIGNIIPHNWKGDIDLLNIVLLGLAEDLPEKAEKYELHRLLGALLSSKLKVDEKLDIIGNEFQIPLESDIRKDVSEMCNLSQGIEDRAYERGTANGLAKAVLRMHKKGYSIEQISDTLDMDIKDVQDIIENN